MTTRQEVNRQLLRDLRHFWTVRRLPSVNTVRARVTKAIEQDKALLAECGLLDAWGNWRALPKRKLNHES